MFETLIPPASPPEDDATPLFQPLADYRAPAMPTDEWVRQTVARMHAILRPKNRLPFIGDDRLQVATLRMLDEVVAPPACAPVLAELDRTMDARAATRDPATRVTMLVLPPGDENDVVGSWAERRGLDVLDAPRRSALLSPIPIETPDLAGEGLLAIPALERWFLRHHNGLDAVRRLLEAIDATDRRLVIGCSSWAWPFLAKTIGIDMVLPAPLTFRAFDGARLQRWLSDLSHGDRTRRIQFRLSSDGTDVLSPAVEGQAGNDYFDRLAARSLGIPWVAWHLWRRSLRSDEDIDHIPIEHVSPDHVPLANGTLVDPSQQVLWVAALDELTLPGNHPQTALLVLHALLIHGHLTAEELRLVLPVVGESNIAATLITSGFVTRDGDVLRCRPAAYPAIRAGLVAAGFSVAPL